MSKISELNVWPLKNNHPTVKANGSYVYDEAFKLKFTLFSGANGMYVSYPGDKGEKPDENGRVPFYPHIKCMSDEVRDEVQKLVVEAYNKASGNNEYNQGSAPGPTNQSQTSNRQPPRSRDGLPF